MRDGGEVRQTKRGENEERMRKERQDRGERRKWRKESRQWM